MPEGALRKAWKSLPDSREFRTSDRVYSLCHNCNNIIEETNPGTTIASLWELIDIDDDFDFPNYSGLNATVQDCWRSRDRLSEQKAVRNLLEKMHIS